MASLPPVLHALGRKAYRVGHQALNRVLQRAGVELIRHPSGPLNCRMQQIRIADIDLVLDVGANQGQHATMLRKAGYKGDIISFEPVPAAFVVLQSLAERDQHWTAVQSAVGSSKGRIAFNVSENLVSSSALPLGAAHLAAAPESGYTSRIEVDVVTLDDVIRQHHDRRIMLKIDVQGLEPEVLEGCGDQIDSIALLDVEMALSPIYDGQQLFDQLDPWIRARGFRIAGLDHAFWDRGTGELLAIDGIYARVP